MPDTTSITVGQTRQLVVNLTDSKGKTISGRQVVWTVENTGIVALDPAGIARGVAVGSTRVFAESESHRDTAVVLVTAGSGGTGNEFDVGFSTYIGGSDYDVIRDMTTDAQGNVYITGGTISDNFQTTPGVVQRVHNPGTPEDPAIDRADVFIMKLDPTGHVIWSTLLGGPNHDRAYGIKVDAQGFVYIAGRAGRGFPVTSNAFQTAFQGSVPETPGYGPQDGFVCKLRPDASAVVFCSYFGTSDSRPIRDLAVDASGNIYLATGRESGTYPAAVANAFTNSPAGGGDAVIAKVKTDGTAVLWATYVGGSSAEYFTNSVRVDGSGNPYLLFTTTSSNAPATAGAYQRTYGGNGDLFVAKFNPASGALVWGTYLGGSQNESTETHEFAVDAQGNAYVVGPTQSPNFPTTSGAFQRTFRGVNDVFAAKLSPDGARLLASTFIGGSNADRPEGVSVDAQGSLHFTGSTMSTDFPVTQDAFQKSLRGVRDAIAVKLSPDFSKLLYSSYFGGSNSEYGRAAVVNQGSFFFGGETTSTDWPTMGGPQSGYGGGVGDAMLVRLAH